MIDNRLKDYSENYKDYKEILKEEAKKFTLDDVMTVIGVFLKDLNREKFYDYDRTTLSKLVQTQSTYSSR